MSVMEWTVQQLKKDSECCGNPFKCAPTEFRSCTWQGGSVIES